MLILVTGGSRSGKSGFALSLAERTAGPRVFLATAQAFDDEMARRIAAHQKSRNAGWGLVEEPLRVPEALGRALGEARTVLLDCVTLWMSKIAGKAEPDELVRQNAPFFRGVLFAGHLSKTLKRLRPRARTRAAGSRARLKRFAASRRFGSSLSRTRKMFALRQ